MLLVLFGTAGCSFSTPPQFELNREGRDPATISTAQAAAVLGIVEKLYGTPDSPAVPRDVSLKLDLLRLAAGPIRGEADGRQWGLYRRHCAGCHGISGDGAGAAAAVLKPYPRDYRNGVFKYTSTAAGAKPTRGDLMRTVDCGIPGTAMPSFRRLPEQEREAVVEYVQYLSLRGETELALLQAVVDDEAELSDAESIANETAQQTAKAWLQAREFPVATKVAVIESEAAVKESIERGRKIFRDASVPCAKCHGQLGDGRGEQTELYDFWNQRKLGATPEQTRQLAVRFKLPLERLRARDFTQGIFHGGDRPQDQFRRVHNGIKGTPMPAFSQSPGNVGVLTSEQIRDVVQYVRSLGRVDSR